MKIKRISNVCIFSLACIALFAGCNSLPQNATKDIERKDYKAESYKIEYFNDLYIIIRYDINFYETGAAHGNYFTKYLIIDLTDGKLLNINELINQIPDEMLKEKIYEKRKIADDIREHIWLRDNIWPPDAVSFKSDSTIFIWNTYTITPYVYGTIEIKIDDKTIEPYFTEKGLELKRSMK